MIFQIQDGVGRKTADLLQFIAQIISSFIVGFYFCPKLTGVLIASIPAVGFAGSFWIQALTAAQSQSMNQYAKAGGLATETLSAIRTVTALNIQADVINQYRIYLLEAMYIGIRKGLNVGIGNGLIFFTIFGTYAVGFWYGGQLVADDISNGCTGHCVTGGTVITVFFSIVMGSFAIGQMAPPLAAFTAARVAAVPIMDILARKPEIDGLSADGRIPELGENERVKGLIQLENVVFAYPSRSHITVCKGYNLTINPGETVALVGASGCGKVMNS